MLPLSTLTFSLKVKTILASTETPVALSAGEEELSVGNFKLCFDTRVYS